MGLAYCIISIILFVFSGIVSNVGFSGLSMLADEFLGTMSVVSYVLNSDFIREEPYTFAAFITMAQTAHLSKAVGRFTDEDSILDKIFIFIGNIFMGCFFSIVYQSFQFEFLRQMIFIMTLVFMMPTMIMMIVGTIYAIFKIGVIPVTIVICLLWGFIMYVAFKPFLIGVIIASVIGVILIGIMTFSNPFTAGLFSVLFSQLVAMLIMALLGKLIPMPSILFLILSFIISYPIISLCDNIFDSIFNQIAESFSVVIEIIFAILSIVVVGIWVVVVL